MFATLEFVMVSGLFLNLVVTRGAALFALVKGAVSSVSSKL